MKVERVNIKKEIDEIMEEKAKDILNKKKKENTVLRLIMENKIDDFSVDEIKDLLVKEQS